MKKPVRGKPVPKAKTHHHAKPVTRAVRTARHAAAVKAAKTRAANAKKAKVHPRRKLALGEGVACCSAEALAASLRLAGVPVSDEDVLALYWRTAADEDTGASILATLEAAAKFGLGGVHPAEVHELHMPYRAVDVKQHPQLGALQVCQFQGLDDVAVALLDGDEPAGALGFDGHGGDIGRGDAPLVLVHALILGVDLPGPHAVLATADGWWSWGELYDPAAFPDAVIEEAWEVTWA